MSLQLQPAWIAHDSALPGDQQKLIKVTNPNTEPVVFRITPAASSDQEPEYEATPDIGWLYPKQQVVIQFSRLKDAHHSPDGSRCRGIAVLQSMMISESLRSVPLTEIFARVNSIVHIDTVVECCGNHSGLGRSQRQAFLHPSHDVVLFATAPEQSQAISLLVNPTDVPVAFKIKVPSRYSKRYSIQPNKGILNPQKWVKIAFVFREDDWDGSFKDMSIRIVTVGLKSWRRSSGASSVTSSIASLASVASEQDIWQNEDARTHVMQVIHQEKRLDIQSSNGCFAI